MVLTCIFKNPVLLFRLISAILAQNQGFQLTMPQPFCIWLKVSLMLPLGLSLAMRKPVLSDYKDSLKMARSRPHIKSTRLRRWICTWVLKTTHDFMTHIMLPRCCWRRRNKYLCIYLFIICACSIQPYYFFLHKGL